MIKALLPVVCICVMMSCKKEAVVTAIVKPSSLYPLTVGNHWVYIDSLFDDSETFFYKDTFYLTASSPFTFDNNIYTPLIDQFNDTVFAFRSDDTSVFEHEDGNELMIFKWPATDLSNFQNVAADGNLVNTQMFTSPYKVFNYPCYKSLVTYNNSDYHYYRQQELYYAFGIGLIRGKDIVKSSDDTYYYFDAYQLISYSFQ